MASIRTRHGKHATTYTVCWRDSQGRQRGRTVASKVEALRLKSSAEQSGSKYPELIGRQGTHYWATDRSGRLTIAGYRDKFLAEHRLSESGRRFYGMAIDKHLVPKFASVAMASITGSDVRCFLRGLERGHSGALVSKVRSVASSMWGDALEAGLVDSNPWRGQRIKAHVAKAKGVMTPAEYKQILAAMPAGDRLLIRCLAETGCRWSEAQRLTPADVIGTTLYIRQSKNGLPRQVDGLAPDLAAELRAGLPFRNSVGRPLDYATFRRWHWLPVTEGLGYGLHDLRHFNASILLQGGADLLTVRDRLGHSSISITSKYLHALPGSGDRAAAALDLMLGRAS